MWLKILTAEQVPSPDQLISSLQAGISTKRHEFREKSAGARVFVVFEGAENHPFWRDGVGTHFVYTDLSFKQALATAEQPNSFLLHTITETDGSEFLRYYKESYERHTSRR